MRRLLPLLLFVAIAVLAIDPPLLFLAVQDRDARAEVLARRADPIPDLAAFLAQVRAQTTRGDVIVLVLPVNDDRLYFRASYLLAGRTVLRPTHANAARADYVAAWPRKTLLRRQR